MSTKATAWVIFAAFCVYFLCAVINLSHGNWASSGNIELHGGWASPVNIVSGNWASSENIEGGNWASSGNIKGGNLAFSGNIEAGLFKVCIAGVCFETGETDCG